MDRETRTDAKLKNLPEEDLEQLWQWRYPPEGGEKLSYSQILEELPARFGISSSLASLSEFYSWLRLRKRMERTRSRVAQAQEALKREDPSASAEDLERLGQMVFTAESIEGGDIKAFVALLRVRNQARALEHDERRISLLERKAEFHEEVKKAAANREGGVTAEEMAEIERRLKIL